MTIQEEANTERILHLHQKDKTAYLIAKERLEEVGNLQGRVEKDYKEVKQSAFFALNEFNIIKLQALEQRDVLQNRRISFEQSVKRAQQQKDKVRMDMEELLQKITSVDVKQRVIYNQNRSKVIKKAFKEAELVICSDQNNIPQEEINQFSYVQLYLAEIQRQYPIRILSEQDRTQTLDLSYIAPIIKLYNDFRYQEHALNVQHQYLCSEVNYTKHAIKVQQCNQIRSKLDTLQRKMNDEENEGAISHIELNGHLKLLASQYERLAILLYYRFLNIANTLTYGVKQIAIYSQTDALDISPQFERTEQILFKFSQGFSKQPLERIYEGTWQLYKPKSFQLIRRGSRRTSSSNDLKLQLSRNNTKAQTITPYSQQEMVQAYSVIFQDEIAMILGRLTHKSELLSITIDKDIIAQHFTSAQINFKNIVQELYELINFANNSLQNNFENICEIILSFLQSIENRGKEQMEGLISYYNKTNPKKLEIILKEIQNGKSESKPKDVKLSLQAQENLLKRIRESGIEKELTQKIIPIDRITTGVKSKKALDLYASTTNKARLTNLVPISSRKDLRSQKSISNNTSLKGIIKEVPFIRSKITGFKFTEKNILKQKSQVVNQGSPQYKFLWQHRQPISRLYSPKQSHSESNKYKHIDFLSSDRSQYSKLKQSTPTTASNHKRGSSMPALNFIKHN